MCDRSGRELISSSDARPISTVEAHLDASGDDTISATLTSGGRAGQVGDIITIQLVERTAATKSNAAGTQLVFKGQPVDLSTRTRDNVARVELP